jgi:hypothetical protein
MAKKKITYAMSRRSRKAYSEKVTIHESPDSFFEFLLAVQRKKEKELSKPGKRMVWQ